MKIFNHLYGNLITKENIFQGWKEFLIGKKRKKDVALFMNNVRENLDCLYKTLAEKTYQPGSYSVFYVRDPKLRLIHKARVADRIVHHIISSQLEPIFESTFIAHSYSCRKNKGIHKGAIDIRRMALKVSKNNTRICWSLKCDVKKFFTSVDHKILFEILARKIKDGDFLNIVWKTIDSLPLGIPIGNLTSQFFSNIYLNELDQFIKHDLKIKYYIRYADDFIILSQSKKYLENLIPPIKQFLADVLDLKLHPAKTIFTKFGSGIDFLGYIIFPHYILIRTKTKKRMFRKIKAKIAQFKSGKITCKKMNQTIQSYLGHLGHANTYRLQQELKNKIWFWLTE